MDFRFEPGNYYLAGKETFDGHEVLKVDYLPTKLFDDQRSELDKEAESTKDTTETQDAKEIADAKEKPKSAAQQERERKQKAREQKLDEQINYKMDKTSQVTLWVDPATHQIVKYTFDNVWMDFLPAGWLVKVDDIKAQMEMGQPFAGVWLPKNINIHAGLTAAIGSLEFQVLARVFQLPQGRRHLEDPGAEVIAALLLVLLPGAIVSGEPASVGRQASPERVAEIRVHGNATLSDDAVIALAGVAPGAMVDQTGLDAIEKRLRDSGRFDEVQVRKRYRTLEMDEIALVLLVHEKPGLSATGQPPSPVRRLRSKLMFFPIIDYEDGYGWTYGGRTSIVNVFGKGTHVMVPLSWGGSRNAQVDVDHTFKTGPLTRVTGSYGILQRENPAFEVDDRRTSLRGRVERRLFDLVTVGGEMARTDITYGEERDRVWTGAADATLDTRRDPSYPVDAVLASAAWNRLNPVGTASFGDSGIDRYSLDARGYKRVFRQNVVAVRAHYDTASAPLPPYDQWLLGGTSVRGLDAGTLAGDKRFLWSAELRVPFTAPLDACRLGVNAFIDGGTTAAHDQALADQKELRSAGAGFWLSIAIFRLNFDVAHSLDGYGTRFHFGTGFSF